MPDHINTFTSFPDSLTVVLYGLYHSSAIGTSSILTWYGTYTTVLLLVLVLFTAHCRSGNSMEV